MSGLAERRPSGVPSVNREDGTHEEVLNHLHRRLQADVIWAVIVGRKAEIDNLLVAIVDLSRPKRTPLKITQP